MTKIPTHVGSLPYRLGAISWLEFDGELIRGTSGTRRCCTTVSYTFVCCCTASVAGPA